MLPYNVEVTLSSNVILTSNISLILVILRSLRSYYEVKERSFYNVHVTIQRQNDVQLQYYSDV